MSVCRRTDDLGRDAPSSATDLFAVYVKIMGWMSEYYFQLEPVAPNLWKYFGGGPIGGLGN